MQMSIRFLAGAARDCILGCFQLHNYPGETLRERIVNVARHSVSFFEDRRALALLGVLIELNGKHDLMRERLGQFDLLRAVSRAIRMADPDKATDLSTDQDRNPEKPRRSFFLQMGAPLAVHARISLHIFTTNRRASE